MNKPVAHDFATRPYVIVELPLPKNTCLLRPDQFVIKVGKWTFDVGAFCYATRSNKRRGPGKPCEVVVDSILKQRPDQVMQFIEVLSNLITDHGMSLLTLRTRLETFKIFLDWADSRSLYDCLAGGDATRRAFLAWLKPFVSVILGRNSVTLVIIICLSMSEKFWRRQRTSKVSIAEHVRLHINIT